MIGADEDSMREKWIQGKIAKCGVYNIKPMLRLGKNLYLRFSVGEDSGELPNNMQNRYIELFQNYRNVPIKNRNLNARQIYDFLDNKLVDGKYQIQSLEIIGHWQGEGLMGYFHGESLGKPTERRNWDDAVMGKVPPIAWFTSNATVKFWGCFSSELAKTFAQNYLRGNAHAYGTNTLLMIEWESNKYKVWFSWNGKDKIRNLTNDSTIKTIDPNTGTEVFLWQEF